MNQQKEYGIEDACFIRVTRNSSFPIRITSDGLDFSLEEAIGLQSELTMAIAEAQERKAVLHAASA